MNIWSIRGGAERSGAVRCGGPGVGTRPGYTSLRHAKRGRAGPGRGSQLSNAISSRYVFQLCDCVLRQKDATSGFNGVDLHILLFYARPDILCIFFGADEAVLCCCLRRTPLRLTRASPATHQPPATSRNTVFQSGLTTAVQRTSPRPKQQCRGVAWRGVAGRGGAWRGVAGRGGAWQEHP